MNDSDTESFHEEKSKAAVYFVCAFPFLLGIAMLIAFFDSLSNLDGDALFLLVLGSAFIAFAVLFYRFSFRPRYELTKRELRIRNFFGVKTIRYDEITALGRYSKTFRPKKSGGGSLPMILTTHHLEIKTRDGKTKTFTLPSFLGNRRLLESIEQRAAKTIEKLPDHYEKGLEPPA
ncbi:hypothetical protein VSU19_09675 [Verrucomicrobiales bacterium BCK34]|nr:hypothetical protein [Verrucomicrobiales bacterium BCK34]